MKWNQGQGKLLDTSTYEMIILGGAVLGGGGGGRLEAGLRIGQLAMELGDAALIECSDLPPLANVVALDTLACLPGQEIGYRLLHYRRAIELLTVTTGADMAGIINCNIGAADTMVGCGQAALTGIPLVDIVFDPGVRSSPPNVLRLLGLEGGTSTSMAIVGRDAQAGQSLEICVHGSPDLLTRIVDQAMVGWNSDLAVAIGPLPGSFVQEHGVAHHIGRSVAVGRAMMKVAGHGGWATANAASHVLGGKIVCFAEVEDVEHCGNSGETKSVIRLQDEKGRPVQLASHDRYLALDVSGMQVASFPDLIIALGAKGTPLTIDEISKGQELYIVVVPYDESAPPASAAGRAISGDLLITGGILEAVQ